MSCGAIGEQLQDARRHGLLHLARFQVAHCPPALFSLDLQTRLWRLDLSFNLLTDLPDAIGSLSALRVLWLHHNPRLSALPAALAQCAQLAMLDTSATAVAALPPELGTLQQLAVLDIADTPLERKWLAKHRITAETRAAQRCREIRALLQRKHERAQLQHALLVKLHDDVYRIDRADTAATATIESMLHALLKSFPQSEDLRRVLRHAERLFPAQYSLAAISQLDLAAFRQRYERLRTETSFKKHQADLELKLRSIYFDRIDPREVERMVHEICHEVATLADLKFLLQHARVLLPDDAKDIDGVQIRAKLVALQQQQAADRIAALGKLQSVLQAVYSDAEPSAIEALVTRVAALFKSNEDLQSLAADAAALFPPEILSASPPAIRAAFQQRHAGMTANASASTLATTTSSIASKRAAPSQQ